MLLFSLFWGLVLAFQVGAQPSGNPPPVPTPTTSFAPVVTWDLGKRHGVWWEKQTDVCFPSDFVTILTRYEYGKFCQSVLDWLRKARVALGMYASEYDSQNAIENRICPDDVRVDAVCPVNSLKNLTKNAAYTRNQLYQSFDELNLVIEDVIAGFRNFPTKEVSPWPDNLSRVQILGKVARLPVTFTFSTTVDQKLFDVNGTQLILPTKDTELESRLTQMTMKVVKLLATCNNLKLIIHNLDGNYFPTDLVSYTTLSSAFSMLMGNDDRVTLAAVQYLETSPVTEVYQISDNNDLSSAALEIKSLLPAKDNWNILSTYRLHVFPISRVGYIQGLKWKKINVTSKTVLINHQNTSMFEYEPSQLICQKSSWEYCRICELPTSSTAVNDPCIINLFSRNSDSNCSYIEQAPPSASLVTIGANQLVLVDKSPGSLVQSCSGENKVFPLQPTTVLNLLKHCTYELLDDEKDIPFLQALLPKNLQIIGTNLARKIPHIVEDLNSMQKHFKDYGYVYFISLAVGFLLLCCGIVCLIVVRCCPRSRVPRRRQEIRDARASSLEQAAEDRLLLQSLVPIMRRPLPSRFNSPRITETDRGIVIESV
jgi:hypothetical protein